MIIATIPKSGTHLYKKIFEEMHNLSDAKLKKTISSCRVQHITDIDCSFLGSKQLSAVTVRDLRGYFYSLSNWCDKRCASILEESKTFPAMRSEKAVNWKKMTFPEKITSLVKLQDTSLYRTELIKSSIIVAVAYIHAGVVPIKYEMIADIDTAGKPTDVAVNEFQKLLGTINVSSENEKYCKNVLNAALFQKTVTYNQTSGGPEGWRKKLSPELIELINNEYGTLNKELGYE